MTLTLTIGAWIIPSITTLILAFYAAIRIRREPAGAYGSGGLVSLFYAGTATIISLVVWIAYLLFLLWS